MGAASLDLHKGRCRQQGCRQGQPCAAMQPACFRDLQHAPGQQRQRQRERQCTWQVQPLRLRITGLRHMAQAQQQRSECRSGCAEQHAAPAPALQQPARQQGSEGQPNTKGGTYETEGPGTPGTIVGLGQACCACRQCRGRTQPLQRPQQVEADDGLLALQADLQQHAANHYGQPRQKHTPPPVDVCQCACRHQRGTETQHEGIGDPVQRQRAAAQRLAQRRQRHGRPGKAQRHGQSGQADRQQHPGRRCAAGVNRKIRLRAGWGSGARHGGLAS